MTKTIKLMAILLVPHILFRTFDLPYPEVLGIVISTLILWLSEMIPMAITSLLIPLQVSVLGLLPISEAFLPFSNPILFLFITCFFLTIAFQKSGLDKRISLFLLQFKALSSSSNRLLFSIALLSWILSMWISNTAACAILIPIISGLHKSGDDEQGIDLLSLKKLLIVCAYGASIGGLCTPVGSPPNLLALNSLASQGVNVSFLKWLSISLPISLTMLILLILILNIMFKSGEIKLDANHFKQQYQVLGKISFYEKITIISFLLTVFLWIFPKSFTYIIPSAPKLSLAEGGLIGTLLLFTFTNKDHKSPLLNWHDSKNIEWGIILLFGGGLCLGQVMDTSGFAKFVSQSLFSQTSSFIMMCFLATAFGIILSELGSNTASAALLLPIIASLTGHGLDATQVVVLTLSATFGASFGFMLPVSTPPNALIFSTGKIKVRDLVQAGIAFDLLGLMTIIVGLNLIFKVLA